MYRPTSEKGFVLVPERIFLEGDVQYRDRQQWRTRWCRMVKKSASGVLRTQLHIYSSRPSDPHTSPSEKHSLEDFCGLDTGRPLEGEQFVLSIVTAHITHTLAFKSASELDVWTRMLQRDLGCEWAFDVKVLPTQKKIQPGDATLRFFPAYFSLTSGNPCTCLGYWMHNQLRKYGGSAGFSFEAGSKCYGGPGVYRLECKDGAAIKDLFDRVANNKRLPDPPHHRSSRTQSLDSVLDTDSSKPAARTPLSASYGDHSQLYTLPPSMGPPTTPDRQSSTSRFPTAHSQGRDHRSSTSPNCERPPIATPPPPLPAKPTPEADYENLGSSPNYDYILAASPRPIDDGHLVYTTLTHGAPTTPTQAKLSPTKVGAERTHYVDVDHAQTKHLSSALQSQNHGRRMPPDK